MRSIYNGKEARKYEENDSPNIQLKLTSVDHVYMDISGAYCNYLYIASSMQHQQWYRRKEEHKNDRTNTQYKLIRKKQV